MQAKGFLASLFDYSFSTFITSRIIKVLYILTTIVLVLWTLAVILWAFHTSSGFGIGMLLIGGPIFFLISLIYTRVVLELIMVIFRIHEDVDDINRRGGGEPARPVEPVATPTAPEPAAAPAPAHAPAPAPMAQTVEQSAPEPEPAVQAESRFCAACGTERAAGRGFCTRCGAAFA